MLRIKAYKPSWSWWMRGGERLKVGLNFRQLLLWKSGIEQGRVAEGLDLCLHHIDTGEGILEAMKRSGMVLPVEAWCLLQAGDRTGNLGESMCEVGEFLKHEGDRKRELIGQLWYPGFVIMTGSIVMGIILLWVVPQMKEISVSMGQNGKVPWLTENIGMLYGCLFAGFGLFIMVLLASWRLLVFMGNRSLKWGGFLEIFSCHIPVYGKVRQLAREARILRQIGTLLKGGITFPDALLMAAGNSPDQLEAFHLKEFRNRQLMGIDFSKGLDACKLFDPVNHQLLVTGQDTGRLDTVALRIASDIEREVSLYLKQVIRVIEPLALMTLSALIAGLVLAYMLPTISMLEQLA